jgi:hypothetical protein
MEMCPYCGEEVPADSAKCWKCGTELSEGASSGKAPGEDLEVPEEDPDEDGGAPKKSKKMIPCPHCESPVPETAARCKECGRPVRELQTNTGAAWRFGTWLVVLGIGIAVAITVVVVAVKKHRAGQVRSILAVQYAELEARIKPLTTGQNERKHEVWQRDFQDKFVKWSGVVVQVHKDTGHVDVVHTKGGKKAEVDVEIRDDARAELEDLKPDDPIVYSARLVEFGKDGFAFTLGDGLIEK